MEKIFIGSLTRSGKRAKAKGIFYSVMNRLAKRYRLSVNEILAKVFEILSPTLVFTVVKRGSTNYIHPRKPTENRAKSLTVSWIIKSAYTRPERGIISKLEGEFNDLISGKGRSLSKRIEFHKKAVSNRFALKNVEPRVRKGYYYSFSRHINKQSSELIDNFEAIEDLDFSSSVYLKRWIRIVV